MKSDHDHLVVGGGVIGLCTAYFLARAGHPVTVINRDPSLKESCSDQNAGMIVPSHFTPLAAPGVISQGLKWMLNRRSPFYLRPRLDPKLWSWCWTFCRSANRQHVEDSQALLRDLSLESRALFEELADELQFPLAKKGLLMLCQSQAGLEEESELAVKAKEIGIQAEVCPPERLRELDPDIDSTAIGGIWYPQDCHLDSELFLNALRRGIKKHGGRFREGDEVIDFRTRRDEVTHAALATGEEVPGNRFTIAGGAWSPDLTRRLGLRLPMQAGKGYSLTLPNPPQLPRLCYLLKEGRVAVTPMGENLRVGGTMEICGNNLSIDAVRLMGIIESFCRVFPQFQSKDFAKLEPWSGLRPCSPDGLPYIGNTPRYSNLTIATGHAMIGLSLAPITGKLVASLAQGEAVDSRLDPDRF
ncbi:MAG: FAD-dependent oxidoreductase [Verrucomicrobiota bacterium]